MSGIGAAAATFLFRGCFRKQNLSGAVARLRGVAGKNAEVAGSSAEDWECREAAQMSCRRVGGAVGQEGPRVGNHGAAGDVAGSYSARKLRRSLTGEWRSSQRVVAHTVPKNSAGHRPWNGGVLEKSWQFNDMLVKCPADSV